MNKLFITILFIIARCTFVQGQTGYVNLAIIDSDGDSNSFVGQIQLIGDDTKNSKSRMYFGNSIYQLNVGNYSIVIPNIYQETIDKNVRLINTFDTLSFQILDSDTVNLILESKIDSIFPTKKEYIDIIDLRGDFYCYGYDCTDSDNRRYGIKIGYYCQVAGISGNIYSVYVSDSLILQIRTENHDKTYYYNYQVNPDKKIIIEKYLMDYNEILSFIRENIKEGKLKYELSWRGKKL